MGKIAVIKTVLLPKILFVFLNANLQIPLANLNTMQAICNKFIWSYKRAHVRSHILEQRLEDGGLAMPNILKYYFAAKLMACLDWWRLPRTHNILLSDQNQNSQPDTLVTNSASGDSSKGNSWIAAKLSKCWYHYQKKLIPPGLPLRALVNHPDPYWLGQHLDCGSWSNLGVVRFID